MTLTKRRPVENAARVSILFDFDDPNKQDSDVRKVPRDM